MEFKPRRTEYAGDTEGVKINYDAKYGLAQQVIKNVYKDLDIEYYSTDNNDYRGGESFCCSSNSVQESNVTAAERSRSTEAKDGITATEDPELFQYFYHSDHLGSASYITNLDGEIAQHIEYVPFGEVFLEERNNSWNTPYLFNGKELDEETGLYYYGARYYDARVSQWLSVDPLAEEAGFERSPYEYTYSSPVKYSDPTGMIGQDDIVLDKQGRIEEVIETENADRILDTDKNVIFDEFSYDGEFKNSWVDGFNDGGEDIFTGIKFSKKSQKAKNLFKSLVDYTDVEWAYNEYQGKSYLHTSHNFDQTDKPGDKVVNFVEAWKYFSDDKFRFSRWSTHMHSHKGGSYKPSLPDKDNAVYYAQKQARIYCYIYTPNYFQKGKRYNLIYQYMKGGVKVTPTFNEAGNLYKKWFGK